MSENSPEKQPAVRPGLLIILLVALGGTLYWSFFMQPESAPSSPAPPPTTAIAPQPNNINIGNQPEIRELKTNLGPISKRDLFLPPPSVIVARRRKDADVDRSNQPVWNESALIKPGEEIANVVKEDENPEKPILKGILGTASAQVIIVRYQNKSYLLKMGDVLSGTEYRVAEINNGAVVLLSPKGRLKLDRKERDK